MTGIFQMKMMGNVLRLYIKTKLMELFAEILKITIPGLIVFLTAWIILRNMIRNDQEKRRQEIVMQGARTVTPLKLQAYERIVLFLERIFKFPISINSINFTCSYCQ